MDIPPGRSLEFEKGFGAIFVDLTKIEIDIILRDPAVAQFIAGDLLEGYQEFGVCFERDDWLERTVDPIDVWVKLQLAHA
jgi:hypothetical protein